MNPLELQCSLSQPFGGNYNPFYASENLLGHPGIDEQCGYDTPIEAYCPAEVFALHTPERPASDGYTCIYTLAQTPLEYFELSYGHPSKIDVKVGDHVSPGQIIGREGNKGIVYQGGQLITLAMQRAGDQRGSHRHIQKRPLYRVRSSLEPGTYLRTTTGTYRDAEGYVYRYAMPKNGFRGCVDFTKPLFTRTLTIGMSGYDVHLLQKALIQQGFGNWEPTEFLGTKTLAALMKFQASIGLTPVGICGPQTRAWLNSLYKPI